MRPGTLLLALLLAAPAAALLAGAQGFYGGIVVARASWGAGEAAPGDAARQVTITLQNSNAQTTYYAVNATVQPNGQFNVSVPGGDTAALSGAFAPGATWNATFTVDLAANLTPNQLVTIPLAVNGQWVNANASVPYTWSLQAQLPLTGRVNLVLVPKVVDLPVSSSVDVQVAVVNQGSGTAGNLRLNLTPAANGLVIAGRDNTWSLDPLGPGQQEVLDVPFVTPAAQGPQLVTAALSYTNAAGVGMLDQRTLSFRVVAAAPGPMGVTLDSYRVSAGTVSDLVFTVTNGGPDAAGLAARFTLPSGATAPFSPVNASDAQLLGGLAQGASANLLLRLVVARSAADVYPVSLDLAWRDPQGIGHDQTFDFGVQVVGLELLEATDGRAAVDNATGAATVTGTLTNVGNAVAHNAYVSLVPGGPFAPAQPGFLGDLATNSPIGFSLATRLLNASLAQDLGGGFGGRGGAGGGPGGPGGFPQGGAPDGGNASGGGGFRFGRGNGTFAGRGGAPVTLLVTFNDDYGNQLGQTLTLPVQLRPATAAVPRAAASSPGPGLGAPVVGAGVVAVGVAGYVWHQRRPKA